MNILDEFLFILANDCYRMEASLSNMTQTSGFKIASRAHNPLISGFMGGKKYKILDKRAKKRRNSYFAHTP
jgi:hypothetical protein